MGAPWFWRCLLNCWSSCHIQSMPGPRSAQGCHAGQKEPNCRIPPIPTPTCPSCPGHIFAAQLLPPSQAADKSLRQVTVLDASGTRPISEAEAAAAAVAAYRHALHAVETLSAQPGKVVDPAAKSQVVCRLLRQVCDVLQAQQAQHAQQAPELAKCLAELQQAGCTADRGSSGAQPGQPSGRDEL